MKKHATKYVLLLVGTALLFNCKKTSQRTESPDPFTYSNELQSSKDLSLALSSLCDVEMIAAYIGEYEYPKCYQSTFASTGTTTAVVDRQAKMASFSFNNALCADGKKRSGSILLNYNLGSLASNANYYHDFGYSALLTLVDYSVDGWRIENFNTTTPFTLKNMVSNASYNPAINTLSWELSGKFKMTKISDSTNVIIIEGKLSKELVNTADTTVFKPSKKTEINWDSSKLNYSGQFIGTTSGSTPFNFTIDPAKPLYRNLNCSVTITNNAEALHSHPFISGVATLTTSTYHPRVIDYGPNMACDKEATVSFHGESYTITLD